MGEAFIGEPGNSTLDLRLEPKNSFRDFTEESPYFAYISATPKTAGRALTTFHADLWCEYIATVNHQERFTETDGTRTLID
jgi:hypothetical protein